MRKQMILLAAAALAAGITACQPKTEGTEPSVSIEETVADSGEESAEGAPESPEESKGESNADAPESFPEDSTPEENLAQIHDAVKKAYGDNYIPSMEFDATMLKELFGIDESWYDAAVAEGPMISAHVETFIAVHAAEGKAGDVSKALEAYRKRQMEEALQYPMNLPKLEASQVVTHGDYVFFVMLGGAAQDAEEQGEEAALESAKENNQIGIDVINGFFQS